MEYGWSASQELGAEQTLRFRASCGMGSRLDQIHDWADRARRARYKSSILATNSGISQSQLRRFFRPKFGRSPQAWLRDLQLADAIELLRGSRLSLKETAQATHFADATALCHSFRDRFGCSPTRYMNRERTAWDQGAPPQESLNAHGVACSCAPEIFGAVSRHKVRILIVSDSPILSTGMAETVRLIFGSLMDQYPESYEIHQIGLFHSYAVATPRWPIYPTRGGIGAHGRPFFLVEDKYRTEDFPGSIGKAQASHCVRLQ